MRSWLLVPCVALVLATGAGAALPSDEPGYEAPVISEGSEDLGTAIQYSEAGSLNQRHDDWYARSPDDRTAGELRSIRDGMQDFVDRWNSYPRSLDQDRDGNFSEEWDRLDRDIARQDWYQDLSPDRFGKMTPDQQEEVLQRGCDQYGSCEGRQPTPPQEGPVMFDGETGEKAIVEAPPEGLPLGS